MNDLTLTPFSKPFKATRRPAGSLALTCRALVVAALARGESCIRNAPLAGETLAMVEALRTLGFAVSPDATSQSVIIKGCGGKAPRVAGELSCADSLSAVHQLSALCALSRGEITLDGNSITPRPTIGELGNMLRNLGVRVSYPQEVGYPPIHIAADGLPGGRLHFGSTQCWQCLSAILQIAPYARHEVRIDLGRPQANWPRIVTTMRLMDEFGATPEVIHDEQTHEPETIIIPPGHYHGRDYTIEPDATVAAGLLACAAIHERSQVTIEGLGKHSVQGESGFADLLHRMGAGLICGRNSITISGTATLRGVDISLAEMPDMAPLLSVVALFAEGPTTLRDVRLSADEISSLATELHKLGGEMEMDQGSLTIRPPASPRAAIVDAHDDPLIAMGFLVAATRVPGMAIRDGQCADRHHPGFFSELARLAL